MKVLRLFATPWNILFPSKDIDIVVKPPKWTESQISNNLLFVLPITLLGIGATAKKEIVLKPRNNRLRYFVVTCLLGIISIANWQIALILFAALGVSYLSSRIA